jgi:hypothetical protein
MSKQEEEIGFAVIELLVFIIEFIFAILGCNSTLARLSAGPQVASGAAQP